MTPQQPNPPEAEPLNVFLLGLLWAGIAACAPALGLSIQALLTRQPVNWASTAYAAAPGFLYGVSAFWRKNKALLKLPPALQAAKDLKDRRPSPQNERAVTDELNKASQ